MGTILIGAALMTGCKKNSPPTKKAAPSVRQGDATKYAEAMRGLREMMLTSPAEKVGISRSNDFPRTYGALMEWPLGDGNIVSVVGLSDGNASLYTTSTFGVIGGVGHESVRKAAANFVTMADKFYTDSTPAPNHDYPAGNRMKFFLVTFDGLRVIETDFDSVANGKSKFSELFNEGQNLLTELRLTTEKKSQ
ncbi:MAG: hypothetical protein WCS42_00420 [Verrucomicrobiota bacterium]